MRRLTIIAFAVPAGLAIGLAAWMLAGGALANDDRLDAAADALARVKTTVSRPAPVSAPSEAQLQVAPLFALTVGPGAVREPVVRVDGISISPRRTAALLSIDGQPAEWMLVGETRDNVALQQVRRSQVVVDTILGLHELGLGEASAPSPPDPAAAPVNAPVLAAQGPAAARGDVPKGFRAPLPPASAPR